MEINQYSNDKAGGTENYLQLLEKRKCESHTRPSATLQIKIKYE